MKEDPGPTLELTPSDIDDFVEKADRWLAEPKELMAFLQRRVLVHAQILDKIIEEPLSGKEGLKALLKAQGQFLAVAEKLTDALVKERALKLREKEAEHTERSRALPPPKGGVVDAEEARRKQPVGHDRRPGPSRPGRREAPES